MPAPVSVRDLYMTVRASGCCDRAGILTVEALAQKTEHELLKIKNLGKKTLCEIKALLADMGLTLGMRVPEGQEAFFERVIVSLREEVRALESRIAKLEAALDQESG